MADRSSEAQKAPQPTNPADTLSQQVDMDLERDSDAGTESTGEAVKRQKTSHEGYTVSRTQQSLRDHSPLRKPPTQCKWDRVKVPPPNPPPEYHEWVEKYASTQPYNREFDKARYLAVPAYRHENPHFQLTNARPSVELPLPGYDAFTPGPFPFVKIADWRHTGNIKREQREMIEANVDNFVMLVPHGGGRVMNTRGTQLAKIYGEYLSSFSFESYDSENVNAKPWSFTVDLSEDYGDVLRTFLLNQQHFAVDPARSFSIHPLQTPEPDSWKLVLLISPYINTPGSSHNDVLMQRAAILDTAKVRLGKSSEFCGLIGKLAANNIGHTGSREQMLHTVLATYHLELATADTKEGPKNAFVLLGRPITSTRGELIQLRETLIRAVCGVSGDHFYVGAHKICVYDETLPGAPAVDCKLCKADTHSTEDCPLPSTRGWKGMTPADLRLQDEAVESRGQDDPRALMSDLLGLMRGGAPPKESARGGKQRGGGNRGPGPSGRGSGGRGGKRG
ncbi:hypothetical protein C8Q80DRAFT_1190788 [Daedaleopsis nitida]|nr:hypothetical protein C8Q80DRAFT_1190788 [Daedaleopsis nitida]